MPKIRFEPDGIEVEVPVGTSILDAARKSGAPEGSACGGVCACSTCHVYVKEGFDDLSEPTERESKMTEERSYVVEITRESRQAFLDEHPEIRAALKAAAAATGAPAPQPAGDEAKDASP